jgi:hypothetical protein
LHREEGRRKFDEKYGATEEAFTLNMNRPGDPPGHIPGFDEEAWKKIEVCVRTFVVVAKFALAALASFWGEMRRFHWPFFYCLEQGCIGVSSRWLHLFFHFVCGAPSSFVSSVFESIAHGLSRPVAVQEASF